MLFVSSMTIEERIKIKKSHKKMLVATGFLSFQMN